MSEQLIYISETTCRKVVSRVCAGETALVCVCVYSYTLHISTSTVSLYSRIQGAMNTAQKHKVRTLSVYIYAKKKKKRLKSICS